MPSNDTLTISPQKEFERNSLRYLIFAAFFIFTLWTGYSVYSWYRTSMAYYEDITPGEDGYIIVDDQRWIQFIVQPGTTAYFEPEGHTIYLSTGAGNRYEKLPNGELRLNGQPASWMDSSPDVYMRAKDPDIKVRVRIINRK